MSGCLFTNDIECIPFPSTTAASAGRRSYLLAGSWWGSYPRSKRRTGSCPAPSRGVSRPRNEGSIRLCEGSVWAPWHKTHQKTKEVPNFLELSEGEVRRPIAPEGLTYEGP